MNLETLAKSLPEHQIAREQVERKGLHEFVRREWMTAQPGVEFVDSWFVGAVSEHLQAVSCRQIKNLVINMPPRHGKSTIVSVLWPAWHWTIDPTHSFYVAAHSDSLLNTQGLQFLNVLRSSVYRGAWPTISVKPNAALQHARNSLGGLRKSGTVGAAITGEGANTQIVDDPIDAQNRNSKLELARAIDWFDAVASSRYAGLPADFARVIIMQRLNEKDIAGHALDVHKYEHLCLPMRYVPRCQWDRGSSLGKLDPRTTPGELLSPGMFTEAAAEKKFKEAGSPAEAEAQWQQNPIPKAGGIIEDEWLRRFWTWEQLGKLEKLAWIQSWDFGFKGKNVGHSRVHGALWAYGHGQAYLIDSTKPAHINYSQSKAEFLAAQKRPHWARAKAKYIEDKANGTAIMSDLANEVRGMIEVEPDGTKEERLIRHSPAIEARLVWMPHANVVPFTDELIHEIVSFPNGAYDDVVDTTTQALDRIFDGKLEKIQAGYRAIRDRMHGVV